MAGRTATFYHNNPASYKAKLATDKKINARPGQRKKRAELNKENRKRGDYGNGDGKDLHHAKNGKLVKMSAKANRGKTGPGEGGRQKGKPHKRAYNAKMK